MMRLQKFEEMNLKIQRQFDRLRAEHPERLKKRIRLSFSVPSFGVEPIEDSIGRLAELGYGFAELPGNYGGADVGNPAEPEKVKEYLRENQMQCSGVCPFTLPGMAFCEKDGFGQQRALDYFRGNVAFCHAVGGSYYLITPGPVGVGTLDDSAYARSVLFLKKHAHILEEEGILAAIEICHRGAVPFIHNLKEAEQYIADVNHPRVQHIYGDMKHLLAGEPHLGQAILDCNSRLLCLHLRDTLNGGVIGSGMMDLDTVIRALYLVGFNRDGCYAVGEPTASAYEKDGGFDPFRIYPEKVKRMIAAETLTYFREREEEVLNSP